MGCLTCLNWTRPRYNGNSYAYEENARPVRRPTPPPKPKPTPKPTPTPNPVTPPRTPTPPPPPPPIPLACPKCTIPFNTPNPETGEIESHYILHCTHIFGGSCLQKHFKSFKDARLRSCPNAACKKSQIHKNCGHICRPRAIDPENLVASIPAKYIDSEGQLIIDESPELGDWCLACWVKLQGGFIDAEEGLVRERKECVRNFGMEILEAVGEEGWRGVGGCWDEVYMGLRRHLGGMRGDKLELEGRRGRCLGRIEGLKGMDRKWRGVVEEEEMKMPGGFKEEEDTEIARVEGHGDATANEPTEEAPLLPHTEVINQLIAQRAELVKILLQQEDLFGDDDKFEILIKAVDGEIDTGEKSDGDAMTGFREFRDMWMDHKILRKDGGEERLERMEGFWMRFGEVGEVARREFREKLELERW